MTLTDTDKSGSDREFQILSSTKVAALLDRYPELEDILIGLCPPFKKLKNPFLRKGVAKVASLRQAATVGNLPVGELVNKLRAVVGQMPLDFEHSDEEVSYFTDEPDWFNAARIVATIDETLSDPDRMPILTVLQRATALQPGEILQLITTFLPAPGIEIMRRNGFLVWPVRQAPTQIQTYFMKPRNEPDWAPGNRPRSI